jgi:hypothetical protein
VDERSTWKLTLIEVECALYGTNLYPPPTDHKRWKETHILCTRQLSIKFGQTKLCALARPMDGWPMRSDNHEDHSSTWWIRFTLRTFIRHVLYIRRSTYHDITRFVAHSTNLSNIPSLGSPGFEDVDDYVWQGCIPESKTEGSRKCTQRGFMLEKPRPQSQIPTWLDQVVIGDIHQMKSLDENDGIWMNYHISYHFFPSNP